MVEKHQMRQMETNVHDLLEKYKKELETIRNDRNRLLLI